jgi:quercetin dioxygenase-like cupin family protein
MKLFSYAREIPFQKPDTLEGVPQAAGSELRQLVKGARSMAIEIHFPKGYKASTHVHDHESIIYIIDGKVRMTVDDQVFEVGPGDACIHPADTSHFAEALTDARWIEFKTTIVEPWKNPEP